jgi:hypothetical protein
LDDQSFMVDDDLKTDKEVADINNREQAVEAVLVVIRRAHQATRSSKRVTN